jgi:DnaJ like chaperone protein
MTSIATAIATATPRWTGKALGAAAALVFAPAAPAALLWWLAAGIGLGHLLDSVARASARAASNETDALFAPASLRVVFAALGRIADASGDLGPAHLRQAERLMSRLALTPERRQEAVLWFYSGRDASFPFDVMASSCARELAEHPVLSELSRDSLCRMCALADTPAATGALLELGEKLGFDREALAQHALALAALRPMREPVEQACDTLGVNADDSEAVIRLAYRRRVARWHPDRLPADASAEDQALAERRMWQLREALETLLAANRR